MTDIELNEAVARKLGLIQVHVGIWEGHEPVLVHKIGEESNGNSRWEIVKPYSTEIAAAWEIIEKHPRIEYEGHVCWFELQCKDNGYSAYWVDPDSVDGFAFFGIGYGADTAPRAICLAFLKLP